MSSPDQPSAPPPNMFGAPHRASPPAVHTATASSDQSPGQAGIGGARTAASRSPAGQHTELAPGADRWVLLDGDGAPGRRKALPSPLQHTEADLADMRIRNLLEENQQLRDALRMDKRVPSDGHRVQQTADAALLAQIRDLNELNWAQRDEISRMQVAQEQQAGKLSKAEANVDRKIEMIQILRAQLDEADQRASSQAAAHAKSNEERMKMQEQLMPLQAQVEQIKKELESERKQKEDAWERMLNVDNQKLAELESKLEDERMNAREMLNELKSLRAEKDALAMERNARRDEAEMMRQSKQTLQGERIEALEQVQFLRQENSTLSTQIKKSFADNDAMMAQLNFLTTQLQARYDETTSSSASMQKNLAQMQRSPVLALPTMNENEGYKDEEALQHARQTFNQPNFSPQGPQAWPSLAQQMVPPQAQALISGGLPQQSPHDVIAPQHIHNHQPQMLFENLQPPPQKPHDQNFQQQHPVVAITPPRQQHMPQVQMVPVQMPQAGVPMVPMQMPQIQQNPARQMGPNGGGMMPMQPQPPINQQMMMPQQQQPPLERPMALMELTADQVLQAGFDPNSVIGV